MQENRSETEFNLMWSATLAASDTVEIRGPVYNGYRINEILNKNGGTITMDATQFAAFFYEIDPNVVTENLTIKKN